MTSSVEERRIEPSRLVLILHSGLRRVDESSVLAAIDSRVRLLPRDTLHVDTQQFAEDVAAGEWSRHAAYLQNRASELIRLCEQDQATQVHYAGLAQIPHVIALGAAVGDERNITVHEYDRDRDSWAWPIEGREEEVVIDNPPNGPVVTAPGIAVLRVAISAVVQDSDVRAIVGDETLADVTVKFAHGEPATTRVRSERQLLAIREKIRESIAAIKNFRPKVETLHLFVAAPNSVCFVLGQELVPRNSPRAQTYIYRPNAGVSAYKPGILITARRQEAGVRPLTEEEVRLASRLRTEVWTHALDDLKTYADTKREHENSANARLPWYVSLEPRNELQRAAPFPPLPQISFLIHPDDQIDPEPFFDEYGHDPEQHKWRLSDRVVLGMYRAAGEDVERLVPLLRLFFFHEYVHAYHSLTKYTAANVGKFANALERLDYTADTYAIFHELDLERSKSEPGAASDTRAMITAIAAQVDQILRSFWAFDGPGPHEEMQVRRVRRYLNWYWRLAQLRRTESLQQAVSLFTRTPAVELAGLRISTDGERRVFAQFQRARSQRPEIAIVLENEKLLRLTDTDSTPFDALINGFRFAKHTELVAWFRPVFEIAQSMGAVYPEVHPLMPEVSAGL